MRRFFLVLFLLPILAIGCSRRETPVEAGIRDQVLHFGNLSEPKDLDPHFVTGIPENNLLSALLEGLVAENPVDLSPVPGVAKSWTVSADGLRYDFTLRTDARWSNGDPVTADDFVFSYRRILSPDLATPYAYMLFCITNAQAYSEGRLTDVAEVGVKAPAPDRLEIRLARPVPYFLSMLNHYSWFPVHPPTLRRFDADNRMGTAWTRPENFVGNGPFTLTSWQPNSKIVVTKSTNYWDRATVTLNAIHYYAIGDHNVEERAFRAGHLHVTGTVPLDSIQSYREKHPELLRLHPYLGCYYYHFNTTRPPLNDARVRRALSLAIRRQEIVDYVTRGGEEPARNFTPPNMAGYTFEAPFKEDADEARRLLAESGYPAGAGFPKIQLLFNTSDAHARIAQAVQAMWKQTLGVEIELRNMEWKVYLDATQSGQYDIARAGWIADYIDPTTFLDLWITGGGNNRAKWSNATYDALLASTTQTADPAARLALFQKTETILMNEMPIMPIYFYRSKALVHPALQGRYDNVLDHHPFKHLRLVAPTKPTGAGSL